MDVEGIIALIKAVSEADIMNFCVEEGNFKLSMDKLKQRMEMVQPTMPQPAMPQPTMPLPAFPNVPCHPMTLEASQDVSGIPVSIHLNEMKQEGGVNPVFGEMKEWNSSLEKQDFVVDDRNIEIVKSPIVGTFYSASGPEAEDFVKIGDIVKKGQILCIIEAMKLMNDIESDFDGEIVEILVQNEQAIEYGQPLYKIKVNK